MLNNLRKARQQYEYSQAEAADHCGITREHWNRLETGKCTPSIKLALIIASCFEMPIDELYKLEDTDFEGMFTGANDEI